MPNAFVTPSQPSPDPRYFSVRAIGIGTFLGGPLVAGFFIGRNFRNLGDGRAANWAFAGGVAATAVLVGALFGIPAEMVEKVPREIIPALSTPLVALLAQRLQGDALARAVAGGARLVSGGVVAGWVLAGLVITLGTVIPFALLQPPLGFHSEKRTFGPGGACPIYAPGDVPPTEVNAFPPSAPPAGAPASASGGNRAVPGQ